MFPKEKIFLTAIGIPTAGLFVYDFSKAKGAFKNELEFQKMMAEPPRPVKVEDFVRKHDAKVHVVDNKKKLSKMLKKEFRGKPIASFFTKLQAEPMISAGNNAAAFVGPSGEGYIIGKGVLAEAVVRHELGHVHDYQARKANMLNRSFIDRALAPLSRRTFDRTIYRDELEAWRRANHHPDDEKIKEIALGTYDKGFHANRAALSGGLLAGAIIPALFSKVAGDKSMIDPIFLRAFKSSEKEKSAYMTPGGGQARVMGANYMQGPVSAMQANRMTRMGMRRPMQSANPMGGSVTAVSQPAMAKQAEVTYRGITFPGYNKPIASNRKGKKKMVLVKKGDKVRIVHFGQKGYEDFTQHKDKKRRKNYLTRSAGIRNKSGQLTKDDPFSPNYWARRKLW